MLNLFKVFYHTEHGHFFVFTAFKMKARLFLAEHKERINEKTNTDDWDSLFLFHVKNKKKKS